MPAARPSPMGARGPPSHPTRGGRKKISSVGLKSICFTRGFVGVYSLHHLATTSDTFRKFRQRVAFHFHAVLVTGPGRGGIGRIGYLQRIVLVVMRLLTCSLPGEL